MAPENKVQEQIDRNLQQIREIIRNCSTESIVGNCLMSGLLSNNYRQISMPAPAIRELLLIGLLVESAEPHDPRDFLFSEWGQLTEPLGNSFKAYLELYAPEDGSLTDQTKDWHNTRWVAMESFMNSFFQTLLATPEQITERVNSYLKPFDEQLSENLGISASSALSIAWWIVERLQNNADKFSEIPLETVLQLGKISRDELVQEFGVEGDMFWRLFTVARGDGENIRFPNEPVIVEKRPLVRLSEDVAMAFNPNMLFTAILKRGEQFLAGGDLKDKFLRYRDKAAESQTAEAFQKIFGGNAQIHRNLFETPDNQYEHDMIILADDLCLFVEVKATSPIEPFRDPEKAYTRIKRAFRSETGLQTAYNQTVRLAELTQKNQSFMLYDRRGNEALHLPGGLAERAFCVCVTRDSHGSLATFLSPLLEKDDGQAYPWAINIFDLQSVAELWAYFNWGASQLRAYLTHRIKLHHNVLGNDELDYVGAFVKHCGLHHFLEKVNTFGELDTTYAVVFDDVHRHLHYGFPAVRINPTYPAIADLTESPIQEFMKFMPHASTGPIKVGRNILCPCGSGVKFKRCHGK